MKTYIPSEIYSPKESKEKQLVPVIFNGKKEAVIFGTEGQIITSYGKFKLVPAKVLFGKWGWHYVLIYPDLKTLLEKPKIILRLDSGCFSGMVLGDITCDCHEQLKLAQKYCVENNGGIVIEIPEHDGRGNKHFKIDIRTYDESAIILKALGFKNHIFKIATNNSKKVQALKDAGIKLSGVKSVRAENPNKFVKKRLKSKQKS